jgi:hypothetical protein
MKKVKYHSFIGRFQCPHLSHRWLIDQQLSKGEPCLIFVRDMEVDGDKNPFTAEEVVEMLSLAFKQEIKDGMIALQIIPDVLSVNYGRGVGYQVIEHKPPEDIKRISATEIRRRIRAKEDGWQEMVLPGTENFLKEKFGE